MKSSITKNIQRSYAEVIFLIFMFIIQDFWMLRKLQPDHRRLSVQNIWARNQFYPLVTGERGGGGWDLVVTNMLRVSQVQDFSHSCSIILEILRGKYHHPCVDKMKREPFKDQSRLHEWEGTDYLTPREQLFLHTQGLLWKRPKALGL